MKPKVIYRKKGALSMTAGSLKKALEKVPDDARVYIRPREMEGYFGWAGSVQFIDHTKEPGGVPNDGKSVLICEHPLKK